jgi:hypothetical protein
MEIINKRSKHLFLYILIDLIIVFVLNFFYLHLSEIVLYGVMIIISSFIILITKSIVANFFHVKVNGKFWTSGLIFSGIATLVASSFGMPIPIPIISYNNYERKGTIKGLKKGEVKVHEKWEITFLSSMVLLLIAFIFIGIYNLLKYNAFFIAGVAIAVFVFVDFLPDKRFNGLNLIYQNSIIYAITFLFLLIMGIFSVVNYTADISTFIAFIIFITVTYVLKLW